MSQILVTSTRILEVENTDDAIRVFEKLYPELEIIKTYDFNRPETRELHQSKLIKV
jgi:hypothetical protein